MQYTKAAERSLQNALHAAGVWMRHMKINCDLPLMMHNGCCSRLHKYGMRNEQETSGSSC